MTRESLNTKQELFEACEEEEDDDEDEEGEVALKVTPEETDESTLQQPVHVKSMNVRPIGQKFEKMSLQAPLKTQADDSMATEQLVSRAGGQTVMERYKWAGQELSDRRCTSDRLQILLSQLKILQDRNTLRDRTDLSYMEDVQWCEVWENLWRIRNAKCTPKVKNVLRVLVANESTAQHAWTSIVEYLGGYVITLSVMEILCLCAERGAKHTDGDLQNILERTNAMIWNKQITLYHITRGKELTLAFLKTLVALQKNKHLTCHLQFLSNFYIVSQEMLQLGKELVHAIYGTIDSCLKSRKIIDILLFIANSHEDTEILIEDLFCENWLKRSPLHLAAIILDSKKSWNCLSRNMIENNLDKRDLHGCTPLHLAHLHHNENAIQFLIAHKAERDVKDKFGMSPKSLERETEQHLDVKYKKLCKRVLEKNCGILEDMRPLLVLSEVAAKALSEEMQTLFECLIKETQFLNAEIVIAGSLREKLKAGRLDEVDVILKFTSERFSKEELLACLIKRLDEISFKGINLRPISVHGPWKFLREGITVSLDVAVVFEDKVENRDGHRLQGELLWGDRPLHRRLKYFTLETWNYKGDFSSKHTHYAYEWDMIDSLPTSCRLAIVIAKVLLQVEFEKTELIRLS